MKTLMVYIDSIGVITKNDLFRVLRGVAQGVHPFFWLQCYIGCDILAEILN